VVGWERVIGVHHDSNESRNLAFWERRVRCTCAGTLLWVVENWTTCGRGHRHANNKKKRVDRHLLALLLCSSLAIVVWLWVAFLVQLIKVIYIDSLLLTYTQGRNIIIIFVQVSTCSPPTIAIRRNQLAIISNSSWVCVYNTIVVQHSLQVQYLYQLVCVSKPEVWIWTQQTRQGRWSTQ
jgi:hypothetical protein